jgi:hypothetical protein
MRCWFRRRNIECRHRKPTFGKRSDEKMRELKETYTAQEVHDALLWIYSNNNIVHEKFDSIRKSYNYDSSNAIKYDRVGTFLDCDNVSMDNIESGMITGKTSLDKRIMLVDRLRRNKARKELKAAEIIATDQYFHDKLPQAVAETLKLSIGDKFNYVLQIDGTIMVEKCE